MTIFSDREKEVGAKIFKKFNHGRLHKHEWPVADFDEILGILSKKERLLIDKVLGINPLDFGKNCPFYGIKPVPKNLITIIGQEYEFKGEVRIVKMQYLPKNVYRSFLDLNDAMHDNIGRTINILSGYRSPAYQLVLFFYYLVRDGWDLREVLKFSNLPGWSEHEMSKRQGMDFLPKKGIALPKDFYKTNEYRWLVKNAAKFGFYLSYPKGNKLGMTFEPWHWHWEGKEMQ